MAKIIDIEGIGPVYAEKLTGAGIRTTEGLLRAAGAAKGRDELAAKIGVDASRILEWVNRADLMRIRGVGTQYSDLLEASGVDSVLELARRNAANLHAAMTEVNAAKKLVRQLPSATAVSGWVEHAKTLDRAVSH
ncbi:MAG: DUF4332 domain-containing protein [Thermomicrobiales bacterium]|nr:DUF4332 domain-containing protein [Thermomicrobiales bacterium]